MIKVGERLEDIMIEKYEKNSYEEAFYGFQERGLYLDTPKEEFVHNQKSD